MPVVARTLALLACAAALSALPQPASALPFGAYASTATYTCHLLPDSSLGGNFDGCPHVDVVTLSTGDTVQFAVNGPSPVEHEVMIYTLGCAPGLCAPVYLNAGDIGLMRLAAWKVPGPGTWVVFSLGTYHEGLLGVFKAV